MSASPHPLHRDEADTHGSASHAHLPSSTPLLPLTHDLPAVLWVTDNLLFDYQRCNRRAFLDQYGNAEQRDPPSDYLMKLRQDSLTHQMTVLGTEAAHRPDYARQDWTVGATATLELMRRGVERITQGVLIASHSEGVWLVSRPSLLIKQPGYSDFGDWLYVPTEIRLGKRPKLDYQITAAFHAYVLAEVQGAWSESSWLMLRERGAYEVDLVEMLPRMEEILQGCVATLRSPTPPELFISHNRCDLCHWSSYCYELAERDRHLSLLPGVTPSRYVHLRSLGITTLETLVAVNPHRLESLPGFGTHVAYRLLHQAESTLHNLALPNHTLPGCHYTATLAHELPTAPIELYFDIEAAPEQNLIYLHGVLVVDRVAQTTQFHPLVAAHPDAEAAIWEDLLSLFWRYPDAPIYHFCPYEVQTVKRLAEQYETPIARITPLLTRFVDLHERVTRLVTLPVESYALKAIARWIGFNWRDSDANGAQSIFWYAQWMETGDRTYLDAILRYNEDDCRATHHLKDWLVEFLQSAMLRQNNQSNTPA